MPELTDFNKEISRAISIRVFQAVDDLAAKGSVVSRQEVFDKAGVFKNNFYRLKNNPDLRMPMTVIYVLVNDYKVSAKWLITGKK